MPAGQPVGQSGLRPEDARLAGDARPALRNMVEAAKALRAELAAS